MSMISPTYSMLSSADREEDAGGPADKGNDEIQMLRSQV